MLEADGKFKPKGSSSAQAGWAKLVHGLGICPESKLVTWKSPPSSVSQSPSSDMKLEIDGECLCHIVNLFATRRRRTAEKFTLAIERQGSVSIQFARLKWNLGDETRIVWFTLGHDEDIAAERKPFDEVGMRMAEGTVVVKHYFNAVNYQHGCSDIDYSLPTTTTTLSERIQALYLVLCMLHELPRGNAETRYSEFIENTRRLSAAQALLGQLGVKNSPDNDNDNLISFEKWIELAILEDGICTSQDDALGLVQSYVKYSRKHTTLQPVLLTHRWLDEVNRIWRRVVGRGGSDIGLLNDAIQLIDTTPVSQLSKFDDRTWMEGCLDVDTLKKVLQSTLDSSTTSFSISLDDLSDKRYPSDREFVFDPDELQSRNYYNHIHAAREVMSLVLQSYGDPKANKGDPWKQELYHAREEVMWLIFRHKEIELNAQYVRFLHFRPESELWKGVWQLRSADEAGSDVFHRD
jgi:hypothetical protein